MVQTRQFLILIGLIVIIGVGLFIVLRDESKQQVPPPEEPPTDEVVPLQVENLELEASATFWQNFMPIIPPEGPPFYLVLELTVTNYGPTTISGFKAVRTTVYFANSKDVLHTFQLEPLDPENNSIHPGETITFEFTNERTTIFSPDLEEGTKFYARILVSWKPEHTEILTSPPVSVEFTY